MDEIYDPVERRVSETFWLKKEKINLHMIIRIKFLRERGQDMSVEKLHSMENFNSFLNHCQD